MKQRLFTGKATDKKGETHVSEWSNIRSKEKW